MEGLPPPFLPKTHYGGLASDWLFTDGPLGDTPHLTTSGDPQRCWRKEMEGWGGKGHSYLHVVGPDR